ncbi:hypothetical protein Pelo_1203 [Pelomyxa schiedti]|nr:hypothetical protein Pelo_1203 [Pelomyxa schiedti]
MQAMKCTLVALRAVLSARVELLYHPQIEIEQARVERLKRNFEHFRTQVEAVNSVLQANSTALCGLSLDIESLSAAVAYQSAVKRINNELERNQREMDNLRVLYEGGRSGIVAETADSTAYSTAFKTLYKSWQDLREKVTERLNHADVQVLVWTQVEATRSSSYCLSGMLHPPRQAAPGTTAAHFAPPSQSQPQPQPQPQSPPPQLHPPPATTTTATTTSMMITGASRAATDGVRGGGPTHRPTAPK